MTISFEFSVKDESRKQSSVSYEEKFTFALPPPPLPLPNWQKCLNDLEDTIEQSLNNFGTLPSSSPSDKHVQSVSVIIN